jgi:hypothetical protein
MPAKGCTILTPFLTPFVQDVPSRVRRRERANVGDGFILAAIGHLIAPITVDHLFSSRVPITDAHIQQINKTDFVLLAGANQLDDQFTIVPGMTPELFRRITVPVIPMGIGLHGQPSRNRRMSPTTAKLLRMMHERISFSSWRCPRTVQYLLQNLPELAPKALMTGCPVQFQPPLLAGAPFTRPMSRLAVTVTDRGGKFWTRETALLKFVAHTFPNAQRILALHQDFRDFKPPFKVKHLWSPPRHARQLHKLAESLGYELFFSIEPKDFFNLYQSVDGHFGSRLHAHLYLLGQTKASYLMGVDDRAAGIAESSDFPLYDAKSFEGYASYDLERYRSRVRAIWPVMQQFLQGLRASSVRRGDAA